MKPSTMMKPSILKNGSWNPYLVGAGIGILSWLVFLLVDKPLGISTEVSKWGGAVLGLFTGQEAVTAMPYWGKNPPSLGYSFWFTIAVVAGAFASAGLAGTLRKEVVPELWKSRFGPSVTRRAVGAFLGGVLLLFGARLADGCTSGHGISGSLQLAASGWLFFLSVMVTGVITARLLFPHKNINQ
jgi:hypothetical protein